MCAAIACLFAAHAVHANDEVPGARQTKPIALTGATIHPVSSAPIENGTIVFARGKIVAVGRDVDVPAGAEHIDVKGQHVYPGLFDSLTPLGLVEIPSVRGTVDEAETGTINPNIRPEVAFNPDSELIPVTRSNGVLLTLVAPSGGLIAGTSAVMQLDGWTATEMTVATPVGMHVFWPRMAAIHTWRLEESAEEQLASRDKALAGIRGAVSEARAYWIARQASVSGKKPTPDHDDRWEAMIPVFERLMPVIVHADEIQQITSAIAWTQHEGFKMILAGGYDAPRAVELLKKHDIPVLVTGTYRLPQRRDDPYDAPFTVPARLHEAGVRFCLAGQGRMGNIRNLAYHAGTATAYGLPADEALKAITIYPAELFGVADRIGSLAAGKDATLIVTTGDPLEIPTQVTHAWVQGRRVDLNDRQKRLWHKYEEKYRRQAKE
ncbi:MAG TPA: amidohydrolase family protein [Pirellulales bacterium]|nr:amidohydrolase family protein [Pirellulales bacterium]